MQDTSTILFYQMSMEAFIHACFEKCDLSLLLLTGVFNSWIHDWKRLKCQWLESQSDLVALGEKKNKNKKELILSIGLFTSRICFFLPLPPRGLPIPSFSKPHVVSNLWMWIMWFTFLWFNIMIKLLCTVFQVTEMKQYVFFKILY
jgi:hypothetical protein